MISKRLITTFESNSSAWWLKIKYNKLALPKNLFKPKKKKKKKKEKKRGRLQTPWPPTSPPPLVETKTTIYVYREKHKAQSLYEIDGKTATLQSNGVGRFSFWQNWFCL